MKKQIRQEHILLSGIFLILAVIGILLFLIPQTENFGTISSDEVDDYLYKKLDEYVAAYEEDPRLASIFTTAISNPNELSVTDRQTYLALERKLFSGWEVAWTYKREGYFGDDRYREWESWYIDEVRRRPAFVWRENREHFAYSEAFVRHVDESTRDRQFE
ncbi:MAG: hypothetical protein WBM41_08550 [Arenicellales bacterium]